MREIWQRYLRRLGWLGILTAVLVTAGVILAATKDYLGGGALIAVALVATQLLPRAIEWYKGQRKEDQEEASLLRIRRPIGEVDPFEEGLVFRSALAERDYPDRVPAYIPRGDRGDIDAKLDEALQTEQFYSKHARHNLGGDYGGKGERIEGGKHRASSEALRKLRGREQPGE